MGTSANATLPKCPIRQHGTSDYSVIRYGSRTTPKGTELRFACQTESGSKHYFRLPSDWESHTPAPGLTRREARLRLARAYPRANEEAWMLVLNELPVTPDFIIADAGPAGRINPNPYSVL